MEAFLIFGTPDELLIFLEEFGERFCYFGETFDVSTTVASHTQDTSELLHCFGRRLVKNCLDSFRIDGGAFSRNDMPKIGDFRKPELAFGELSVEVVFVKLGENETQMFRMLFVEFRVDKDVIEIDHYELVEVLHEDRIHETRESRRSIGETE